MVNPIKIISYECEKCYIGYEYESDARECCSENVGVSFP